MQESTTVASLPNNWWANIWTDLLDLRPSSSTPQDKETRDSVQCTVHCAEAFQFYLSSLPLLSLCHRPTCSAGCVPSRAFRLFKWRWASQLSSTQYALIRNDFIPNVLSCSLYTWLPTIIYPFWFYTSDLIIINSVYCSQLRFSTIILCKNNMLFDQATYRRYKLFLLGTLFNLRITTVATFFDAATNVEYSFC